MKKALGTITLYVLPFFAMAQTGIDLAFFDNIPADLQSIVDALIPVVTALALLFFFWGLAKFILAAGDEAAKDEGKRIMIWGVVALFVMAAVWGIIQALAGIFDVNTGGTISVPNIN